MSAPGETQVEEQQVDEMFQQGVELGRVWAQQAAAGFSAWAEKSPEQVVIAGLVAGFVLGKLLLAPPRRARISLDDLS